MSVMMKNILILTLSNRYFDKVVCVLFCVMVDFCKKHKDIMLKHRKDKKGKFCPECAKGWTTRGRGKFVR